jgi:hypothetical protein
MRPVPPQRALPFVAKRSPGRERLSCGSERPIDPDLVAAFSREQLPAPSAPGGRSSGIAATERRGAEVAVLMITAISNVFVAAD